MTAGAWPKRRVGEVADLLPSRSIANDGDTEVRAVTTACLSEVGFLASGVKPARMWAADAVQSVLSPGDVLVARSNTPELVGRAAMFAGLPEQIVASDLTIRIRPKAGLMPPFLASYLSFLHVTGYWKARAGGASGSMKKITRAQVEAEEIPVPPLDEQRRIVAQLGQEMAAVERARAAAEAQLAAATRLPASCLQAQFDTAGTQAWPRRRVKEVAVLLPSKSISTNGDFEVIAVTTACLAEAGFLPAGAKPARMWAQDATQCIISRGEVLVARSNTPDLVGRVAMFDGEPRGAVASDLTVRIHTREDLMPEFLTRYLSFLYLTGYWKDRAGGASGSMKKITRGQIESERVPVPAIEIQQQVVAALKDRMAETGRILKHLEDQLAAIHALPAALLRRAFGGAL